MQIAVLDPDDHERALIVQLLERSGFDCVPFEMADALRIAMGSRRFDAFVVDCRSSQRSDPAGRAALGLVEAATPHVATLAMIDGNDDDIIAALSAGADDYLLKPIRPSELVARLQAMLRRTYPHETLERFDFAPFTFMADACEVHVVDGSSEPHRIALTQKEFDLGLTLFRNAGRPLSRNHLRELVWGGDADVTSRTMDTHVSRLRTKLSLGPGTGYRVLPVYGYGYRLDRLEG